MSQEELKSSAVAWGGDEATEPNSARRRSSTPPTQPARQQDLLVDDTPNEAPPSYTPSNNVTTATASSSTRQPRPAEDPLTQLSRLANVPWKRYHIPSAKLSPDRTTITTTHNPLCSNHDALRLFLTQQSYLPPHPTISIRGTHRQDTVIDFDLSFSLLSLLDVSTIPTTTTSPGWLLMPSPPPGTRPPIPSSHLFTAPPITSTTSTQLSLQVTTASQLTSFTRHFTTHSTSENRSITLTRLLPPSLLSTTFPALEGRIRILLANLKYRGKVEISFPVENEKVVVHKQPGNWVFKMLGVYPERKFEAFAGEWQLREAGGDTVGGHSSGVLPEKVGRGKGKAVEGVDVAEQWWAEWEGVLKCAVLRKQRGKVGVEDWIGWKMHGELGVEERRLDWGVDM